MKNAMALIGATMIFLGTTASAGAERTMTVGKFPQRVVAKYPLAAEVRSVALCAEGAWAGTAAGALRFDGRQWLPAEPCPRTKKRLERPGLAELSAMPVRERFEAQDGGVSEATARGLRSCAPDQACALITGKHGGLPFENVLSLAGKEEVLWVGTSMGAARWDGRQWQYLQGPEYLLDDRVADIAIDPDGAVWLATPAGVTRVEYKMMTLEEKAAHFEAATRARHLRHGLVADSDLKVPGDLTTNTLAVSDNDGLWTAMYIAAECYRFAATHDPEAKRNARQSLEAMMFLETVTGIPGFMARSYAKPDEPTDQGEWDHLTPDGQWRWKGDTSSDEVDGHFYAYSIYYDLCADAAEKEEIKAKVRRITDYIIAGDYYLLDTDGQPTRWGRWNFFHPWYMRAKVWSRGLNSLEILSHLKAAYHITGDEKYQAAYLELAVKRDYAKFTVHQKIIIPNSVNHSDDELAFLSYYPLLKYEQDPELLKFYRASLTRSWQIEQPERCPLFNFIYGAVMPEGTDFDLPGAVFTLQRISLDLVKWDHVNSRRADLKPKTARGRFKEQESVTPLPPDERSVMKWNGNPYALDTGSRGRGEEAGTFWLLPYWMGRYYGFIGGDCGFSRAH
jgi:hypothetical protein